MSREEIVRDIGDLVELLGALKRWRDFIPRCCLVASATIDRSDTGQKRLFTVPAGHEMHMLCIHGETGVDLATLAWIDIGTPADPTRLMTGHSVLGVLGVGQKLLAARNLGQSEPVDVLVSGRYTETGLPSTTGGPWVLAMLYSKLP